MTAPRLASGIWVAAYLARLGQRTIPAYVLRRGDDTAGAVAVKVARLDGTAQLWLREWDFQTDLRPWRAVLDGADVVVLTQGPGNLGTGTRWGFSGVACGDAVNAIATLGGRPVACLRVSQADARPRHLGVSHHSMTAYGRVALASADVVLPVAPHAERSGTFLDWEGRVGPFQAALETELMSDYRVLDLLAGDLRRDGDLLAGDAALEPDALDLDDLGREDGALGAHDDLLLIGPQVALAVGPLAVDVGGAGPRLDRRGRGRRPVDRHPDDLDLLAAQRDGERDVLGDDAGPDDDALPCYPLGADDEALLADHEAVAVIEALDGPVVTVDGVLGRVVGHAVRPRRRDDLRRWAQQPSPDPRSPQARWELRTTAQGWEDVPP